MNQAKVSLEPTPYLFAASCKRFEIRGFTVMQIRSLLGPSIGDIDNWKSRYEWHVREAGGVRYAQVWDYKLSHRRKFWSAWGDRSLLEDLFGAEHVFNEGVDGGSFGNNPLNYPYDSSVDTVVNAVHAALEAWDRGELSMTGKVRTCRDWNE